MTSGAAAPARGRVGATPSPGRHRGLAAARLYSCALLTFAIGATAVVVDTGASLPPIDLCLAFAIPLALCMNRFVFFPNEVGVTAEAAVLFAAVVAFRSSSPVLGPLALALLVGVLDAKHWERRAFVRMAYNSGSQALTVLVAVVVFGPVERWCGSSGAALVVAVVLSAVPYVLVESGFGVVLMMLLGERARLALRQQVPANLLALPLAAVGAVAGVLAVDVGPWLGALLLVPTPLVPEAVLVGARRRCRPGDRAGGTSLAIATGACAVGLAVLAGTAPTAEVAAVVTVGALAVLLGADCRVRRDRAVPSSATVAIVAASVLVPGGWAVAVGALAAVLATASAWWVSGGGRGAAAALALAAGGATCAAAVGVVPAAHGTMATFLAASAVGVAFLVLTTRQPVTIGWSLPLIAASAGAVLFARTADDARGPLALLLVGVVVGAAAVWGALPWSSRCLGPWGGRRSPGVAVGALAGASLGAVGTCAWWAADATDLAAVAVTAGVLLVILLASTAVRQWRFAPRRRRRDIGALLGAAGCLLGAGPLAPGAVTGWSVAASLAAVVVADAVAVACVRTVWSRPRLEVDVREPDPTS